MTLLITHKRQNVGAPGRPGAQLVFAVFCWYHIQGTQRPQVPQSDRTRLPLVRGRRQEDNHPSEAASCKTAIHERLQVARQLFMRGCK
jgi:hypothetical protein